MIFEIILAALLIMTVSLIGVLSVWKNAGNFFEKNLSFLVSFSAGVFLIISSKLAIEVVEKSNSLSEGIFWILVGAIGISLLFKVLPSFHHHHDEKKEKDKAHSHIDARKILLSDALHNMGDGILLAASFTVSTMLGIITTLSVFIHEIVQEISEFFVLRQAGLETKKALKLNFLTSTTILLGALGGFFLLEEFKSVEVPLLGIASGSFLVVVFFDLIPHSIRESGLKTSYFHHLLWFIFGIFIMVGLNVLVKGG